MAFIAALVTFLAFLLGTLTSPITRVPLGLSQSVYSFGTFGACDTRRDICLDVTYPYEMGYIGNDYDWVLGIGARNALARTLILIPIGAGLYGIHLILVIISIVHPPILSYLGFTAVIGTLIAIVEAVIVPLILSPHVEFAGWYLVGGAFAAVVNIVLLVVSGVQQRKEQNREPPKFYEEEY